jgi:hypothetical protein
VAEIRERLPRGCCRELERGNGDHLLAWDLERLTARDDNAHAGGCPKHVGHDFSGGVEHVLAVVEDEEQLSLAHVG